MVSALPLDESQIARAAEDMIGEYGDEALTKADERVKKLKSEGFDSIAKTWELIREVIKDQPQSDDQMRGCENAPKIFKLSFYRNEILIHNPENKVIMRRRP